MRTFLPSILVLLLIFNCRVNAQDFDLSKYRLPEIKRHQLYFNFSSNGNSDITKEEVFSNQNIDKYKMQGLNLNGVYSFYKNTAKTQSNLFALPQVSYSYNKVEENDQLESYDSDFRSSLNFNYDYKSFFNAQNWFLSVIPNVYFINSKNGNLNANKDKIYDHHNTTNLRLGVGIGKGRIEQVQDYRQAILLISELQKKGLISSFIDEETIINLADRISVLKNKRFFDSRKKYQYELTEVHQFLTDNKLLKDATISYYVTLEDMWKYGDLQVRESGDQWFLNLAPEFRHVKKDLASEANDLKTNINRYYLNTGYKSKKPISVKWQRDYIISLNSSYMKRKDIPNNIGKKEYLVSSINGNYFLGYYPNTRTYVLINALNIIQQSNYEFTFRDNRFDLLGNICINAYYYLSERLRANGRVEFNYAYNNFTKKDEGRIWDSRFTYWANISYAIF